MFIAPNDLMEFQPARGDISLLTELSFFEEDLWFYKHQAPR
jgi:hypothetical protein